VRRRLNVKNTTDKNNIFFSIIPMGVLRYSCPTVPTYILPAKERRLLGKFRPDSFRTDGLSVQTDMARSTRLVTLIKNMHTLGGRKRLLHCVANFWRKSEYPLQVYKNIKCWVRVLEELWYFEIRVILAKLWALIVEIEANFCKTKQNQLQKII